MTRVRLLVVGAVLFAFATVWSYMAALMNASFAFSVGQEHRQLTAYFWSGVAATTAVITAGLCVGAVVVAYRSRLKILPWTIDAPISEAAIRTLHLAPENFRFSRHVYAPGTNVAGRGMSSHLYVIRGACRVRASGGTINVEAGNSVLLPSGDHLIVALDHADCEIVQVWDLRLIAPRPPN